MQQQNGGGHKGPNLSLSSPSVGMSLCNQRQTTAQDYSGLELALPWLRTTSDYGGSSHRPPPAMDNILHPIISHEKANVEAFSASSVQNFLPLTGSMSSRELGSSQWMVGSSDSASSLEAGQQTFSLLEPAVEFYGHDWPFIRLHEMLISCFDCRCLQHGGREYDTSEKANV